MCISFNTIDYLISNLINFKKRLYIELDECNKTKNSKLINSISEILKDIESGISFLPSIRNQYQQDNLSIKEKEIIRHFTALVNQNYASVSSRAPKSRLIVNTYAINRNTNFESPNKSNIKRPQFHGISSSHSSNYYTKQEEKSKREIVVEPKKIKKDANPEVVNTDYFLEKEGKKQTISKKPIESIKKKPTESISKKPVSPKKSSQEHIIEKKYAIYPDTPNGFLDIHLSKQPGELFVYELQFHSNTEASFIISDNLAAQQKAISNSSFILKTACQYLNIISSGKKIVTINKGRAQKNGEMWKITKKADIKFM